MGPRYQLLFCLHSYQQLCTVVIMRLLAALYSLKICYVTYVNSNSSIPSFIFDSKQAIYLALYQNQFRVYLHPEKLANVKEITHDLNHELLSSPLCTKISFLVTKHNHSSDILRRPQKFEKNILICLHVNW